MSNYESGYDAYQKITDVVLGLLDQGIVPWRKTWKSGGKPMNIDGRPYSGLNALVLSAMNKPSPYWLTWNEIKQRGGYVKAGAKAVPVVFFKGRGHVWYEDRLTEGEVSGQKCYVIESVERSVPLMRYYLVFSLDDTEGVKVPKKVTETLAALAAGVDRNAAIESAESIVEGYVGFDTGPAMEESDEAWYKPVLDVIGMPARERFDSSEAYYATLFHEMGHSTGAAGRLGRTGIVDNKGMKSDPYANEELMAEMCSTFLMSEAGLSTEMLPNAVAYIQNWMARLKADKKLLAVAAGQASKAAAWVVGIERGAEKRASSTAMVEVEAPLVVVGAPVDRQVALADVLNEVLKKWDESIDVGDSAQVDDVAQAVAETLEERGQTLRGYGGALDVQRLRREVADALHEMFDRLTEETYVDGLLAGYRANGFDLDSNSFYVEHGSKIFQKCKCPDGITRKTAIERHGRRRSGCIFCGRSWFGCRAPEDRQPRKVKKNERTDVLNVGNEKAEKVGVNMNANKNASKQGQQQTKYDGVEEKLLEEHVEGKGAEVERFNFPDNKPERGVRLYGYVEGYVAHFDSIEISKSKRGKGLGRRYVDEFEEWAAAMGAKTIVGHVYRKSASFWAHMGYYLGNVEFIDGRKQDYVRGSKVLGVTPQAQKVHDMADSEGLDEGQTLDVVRAMRFLSESSLGSTWNAKDIEVDADMLNLMEEYGLLRSLVNWQNEVEWGLPLEEKQPNPALGSDLEHKAKQHPAKPSKGMDERLVGYVRKSNWYGQDVLAVKVSREAFDECTPKDEAHSKNYSEEYVTLHVSAERVLAVLEGEREVTSVVHRQDRKDEDEDKVSAPDDRQPHIPKGYRNFNGSIVMEDSVLHVGDSVVWRGGWGTEVEKVAVVVDITICYEEGDKDGVMVEEVPWQRVVGRRVIVGLNNQHWAWAEQVRPVVDVLALAAPEDRQPSGICGMCAGTGSFDEDVNKGIVCVHCDGTGECRDPYCQCKGQTLEAPTDRQPKSSLGTIAGQPLDRKVIIEAAGEHVYVSMFSSDDNEDQGVIECYDSWAEALAGLEEMSHHLVHCPDCGVELRGSGAQSALPLEECPKCEVVFEVKETNRLKEIVSRVCQVNAPVDRQPMTVEVLKTAIRQMAREMTNAAYNSTERPVVVAETLSERLQYLLWAMDQPEVVAAAVRRAASDRPIAHDVPKEVGLERGGSKVAGRGTSRSVRGAYEQFRAAYERVHEGLVNVANDELGIDAERALDDLGTMLNLYQQDEMAIDGLEHTVGCMQEMEPEQDDEAFEAPSDRQPKVRSVCSNCGEHRRSTFIPRFDAHLCRVCREDFDGAFKSGVNPQFMAAPLDGQPNPVQEDMKEAIKVQEAIDRLVTLPKRLLWNLIDASEGIDEGTVSVSCHRIASKAMKARDAYRAVGLKSEVVCGAFIAGATASEVVQVSFNRDYGKALELILDAEAPGKNITKDRIVKASSDRQPKRKVIHLVKSGDSLGLTETRWACNDHPGQDEEGQFQDFIVQVTCHKCLATPMAREAFKEQGLTHPFVEAAKKAAETRKANWKTKRQQYANLLPFQRMHLEYNEGVLEGGEDSYCGGCMEYMAEIEKRIQKGESFHVSFRPDRNASGVVMYWHVVLLKDE